MLKLGLPMLVVVLAVSGCGSDARAVLHSGYVTLTGHPPSPDDAQARRQGRRLVARWEHDVRARARAAPGERFANLPPHELLTRLRRAAKRYRFTILHVRLLRPKQLAPEIVVRTTHYLELSRAMRSILANLDPHGGSSDLSGWSYEGFLFEARDERGVPFLATFTFLRGADKGGGQWARSEALYPFAHG